MHRHGHLGLALLVLAPIVYVLASSGQPALALLVAVGVITVEPRPDNDHWIPGLSHRGVSHSLTAAGIIGVICAGFGWLLGRYVTVPLAEWLAATTAGIDTTSITVVIDQLAALDPATLTFAGFAVGVGGICVHLAGDIITTSGIKPFLPFSRRRVSLSGLHADSTLANSVLFLAGTVAMATVGYMLSLQWQCWWLVF
ncbi:metal-dependent hydrolase [Halomicrococcus sp. NG-SE-24]|uniref:metal-dependent hydrolase n=1 Tax=Halomicrococcus sp. NG-SE-24 TaxID=3436928 RepID=UPI003D991EE9